MKPLLKGDRYSEEEDIYNENLRDDLVDDGELSPTEAGFMHGYCKA